MTLEILLSHRRSSFAAFILTGRNTLPLGTAYVLPPGTTGRVRQRKSAHLFATRDEGPGQGSANTTGRSGDKHCHDTLRLFWGSDLVESRRKLLAEVKSGGSGAAQTRSVRCMNSGSDNWASFTGPDSSPRSLTRMKDRMVFRRATDSMDAHVPAGLHPVLIVVEPDMEQESTSHVGGGRRVRGAVRNLSASPRQLDELRRKP